MTIQKPWLFLFVGILSFLNLSMTWDPAAEVLTEEDLEMAENQDHPALSAAIGQEPHWESYNEWQCFPTTDAETLTSQDCETDNLNKCHGIPTLEILYGGQLYSFDNESADPNQTKNIVAKWNRLMSGQEVVCVFGAKLQENDVPPNSPFNKWTLWVPEQIKTKLGSWSFRFTPSGDGVEEDEKGEEQ